MEELFANEGLHLIVKQVLSFLDGKSLAQCRLVSTSLKNLTDNHRKWYVCQLDHIQTKEKTFIDYEGEEEEDEDEEEQSDDELLHSHQTQKKPDLRKSNRKPFIFKKTGPDPAINSSRLLQESSEDDDQSSDDYEDDESDDFRFHKMNGEPTSFKNPYFDGSDEEDNIEDIETGEIRNTSTGRNREYKSDFKDSEDETSKVDSDHVSWNSGQEDSNEEDSEDPDSDEDSMEEENHDSDEDSMGEENHDSDEDSMEEENHDSDDDRKDEDDDYIGIMKTSTAGYPKKFIQDKMQDWPAGSYLLL